jgi:hypothetical protein
VRKKETKRQLKPADFAAAVFVFCFFLTPRNTLSAQYDPESVDYFSVSAGGKLNGFIRGGNSIGFGAVALADYRFFKHFSAGVRTSVFSTSEVLTGQFELLARYYIYPLEWFDVYLSASAGIDAIFRGEDPRMSRGSFVFAGETGIRISLPFGFYVEPFVRSGYPFLFSGGIAIGYRFTPADYFENAPAYQASPAPAVKKVVVSGDISYYDIVYSGWALFAPDSEIYNDNLNQEYIKKNNSSVAEIVRLLNNNSHLFVRLESFVYPVPEPDTEERYRIKNLIYKRETAVAALLREFGINSNRILIDANPLERRQPMIENEVNNHVEMMLISARSGYIKW